MLCLLVNDLVICTFRVAAHSLPVESQSAERMVGLDTTAQVIFGPYKYTASEGLVDVQFYAGDHKLSNATLVAQAVDVSVTKDP